jgi:hypothetical protein
VRWPSRHGHRKYPSGVRHAASSLGSDSRRRPADCDRQPRLELVSGAHLNTPPLPSVDPDRPDLRRLGSYSVPFASAIGSRSRAHGPRVYVASTCTNALAGFRSLSSGSGRGRNLMSEPVPS